MVAVWEDRMQARFLSALFNRGAVCGQAIAGMICSQGRKANTPVRWLGGAQYHLPLSKPFGRWPAVTEIHLYVRATGLLNGTRLLRCLCA